MTNPSFYHFCSKTDFMPDPTDPTHFTRQNVNKGKALGVKNWLKTDSFKINNVGGAGGAA